MKLALDVLRSCATGCAELREEPEGLYFDRMTPALRRFYGATEGAIIRARCSSGIRLRFAANSSTLRLSMRFGRAARNFDTVDLFVDGEPRGTFTGERQNVPWSATLFKGTDKTLKRFELWLPSLVESWLTALEVDDGAIVEPLPPEPVTWLAIGDSITQGMTCSSPSRTYAARAAGALGFNHHNTGMGGARMEAAAAEAAALPCALATAAFGCNDWNGGKSPAQFEADAVQFVERFFTLRPGVPLGLITPFPAVWASGEQTKDGQWLESFRQTLRALAPRYPRVRLLEGPALVPADPRYFVDGIHPNDLGMAVIAKNLIPELRSLLPRGIPVEVRGAGTVPR